MPKVYIPDTHALLWFLAKSNRLSSNARKAFIEDIEGNAQLIVPAIVIAEIIWVVRARKIKIDLFRLLDEIKNNYFVSSLVMEDVMQLPMLPSNLTIHDAIILWEAKKRDAILITRDETLIKSKIVETVW